MGLYYIRIIAAYEMRTLLRSWFFRIFAFGFIFGLTITNIAMNVESSGAPWIYKALPVSVPYINLIILNIGQAVVATLLASEFLKQDKKNDTVEVIYARSMSNAQYIAGKTLGILAVFLTLNLIILIIGTGLSFISNATAKNIPAYFTYVLLISLPTLVYVIGLSFFLMIVIKNQAVTFILLIGYIALTVFYLNDKAYHIFDFIAYQVPMIYSSISGFADTKEMIIHRCIYLLLGSGFIFLTIYKLQRLPQSFKFRTFSLLLSLVIFLLAGYLITRFIQTKHNVGKYRHNMEVLNNIYGNYDRAVLTDCSLDVVHNGKKLNVTALITLKNLNQRSLDTLILSLNPLMKINSMEINGAETDFIRELQIIIIPLQENLDTNQRIELKISYGGGIIENVAFLDKDVDNFGGNFNVEVFTLRKRYAFLNENFVCLTPEILWYPIAGTGFISSQPLKVNPDFTNFKLKVKTHPGLTVVSQGNQIYDKNTGTYTNIPGYALPGMTLLIGNYVKHSVSVDSVEYSIYSVKGHDFYYSVFNEISDTIPALIRDLKKEYEAKTGFAYPFRRLFLAEVPLHFALDNHRYSYASDAVQPEMILYPEKGILFFDSDFRYRKYRVERSMRNNNEQPMPGEVQSRMFSQFIRTNFLADKSDNRNFYDVVHWFTYSLFPQYLTFNTQLETDEWQVMNKALEMYLSERNMNSAPTLQWYQDLSLDDKINIELSRSSLEDLVIPGARSDTLPEVGVNVRNILQAKGLQFFYVLRARLDESVVDSLVIHLVNEYGHRKIPFKEFETRFNGTFTMNISDEIERWYMQKELPGFIIRNISTYKVTDEQTTRYQLRFLVSNPENTDGIVTLNMEMNDPNRQRQNYYRNEFIVDYSDKIFIPARSSFEIGYVFNTEPTRMSMVTNVSRNLPNNLVFDLPGFDETRKVQPLDDQIPVTFFSSPVDNDETVTDNNDPEFTFWQSANEAYLKGLIKTKISSTYGFSSIRFWRPPRDWQKILRSDSYGKYEHSALYTRSGANDRSARWEAVLPEKGSYDVYFYYNKVDQFSRRNNVVEDYHFKVLNDNGEEDVVWSNENADTGWEYLGTYSISMDTTWIELSNLSSGSVVFADAVKWKLNK